MTYPAKVEGIAITDKKDWLHPKKASYDLKTAGDRDVDIKVIACGVCGSDVHCAAGRHLPLFEDCVVGHEIIGEVVKVGPKCTAGVKVGDRVGVGAQSLSCLECESCIAGNEQYCKKNTVYTIASIYPDGSKAQGGFGSHVRTHEYFVHPIPKELDTVNAAPLLCGGITAFSPLLRGQVGPGKTVGIVGIGGIGHIAILFAKAMGAKVIAISRSASKKEDCLKLGADEYIASAEGDDWKQKFAGSIDFMLLCNSSFSKSNFDSLFSLIKLGGEVCSIGIPDMSYRLSISPLSLLGIKFGFSALGSRNEFQKMFELVKKNNIKLWVETLPIGEKGLHEAFERVENGDVKYRCTMVDYDKEFGN
ncbi:hypothetical protein TPHA_0J00170 [Tetrapisispora phaffii CBS 4417]|uniref:Enoyl reductase (ER) domain-containing protein n=1 Tax=Tetrapisispora phaffii (strain ATCC 24235 / CBS 4417 / NBRC 1672 / NRRL Y-8282 / UCD 70-5) TaxID=1071381 RepID=G8BY99_TETPH|nr:hypothetical protein TPHA_0J00170 [Tetrapisispora phaffii CBS 4417]CCE64841.1 hypothetical protein TPHA_0J00170 [Tetrapisispora phaffii CBS 4417]